VAKKILKEFPAKHLYGSRLKHRYCVGARLRVRVVWRERAWIFVDLVGFSAGLLYDFWHIVG